MAEAEMDKLVYEAQVYRQQGEQLQSQMGEIAAGVSEAMSALDALKALKNNPEISMVPVGSGVYVKGGKINASVVLVGVGANILVEKPLDEAITIIEKRIETSRELSDRLEKALNDINTRLNKIDERARKLMADEEGAGEGVQIGVRPSKK